MCWSLFFNKVAGRRPKERDSKEIAKFLSTLISYRTHQVAASEYYEFKELLYNFE